MNDHGQRFLVGFDKNQLLLDDPIEAETYRADPRYFQVLGFLASTLRDYTSTCSIYQGDEYLETIDGYLLDLMDQDSSHDFIPHRDAMLKKAVHVSNMLPDGIFERLDLFELNKRSIYFIGIVHGTDYR